MRFPVRSAFLLLAMTFAMPAWSATTDLKDIPSGVYALDPNHASITFRVLHLGFSRYTGRFDKFDATLDFDSANPENSKLDVIINPNSVNTNNAKLEEELKAEPYFNTVKFPAMTFVATKIERTGDTTGTITGDFTMLGVTRSVTLDATFIGGGEHPMMKKPTLGFSATGSLKRSAFGLEKLIPMVGDDVTFDVQAEFNKR